MDCLHSLQATLFLFVICRGMHAFCLGINRVELAGAMSTYVEALVDDRVLAIVAKQTLPTELIQAQNSRMWQPATLDVAESGIDPVSMILERDVASRSAVLDP